MTRPSRLACNFGTCCCLCVSAIAGAAMLYPTYSGSRFRQGARSTPAIRPTLRQLGWNCMRHLCSTTMHSSTAGAVTAVLHRTRVCKPMSQGNFPTEEWDEPMRQYISDIRDGKGSTSIGIPTFRQRLPCLVHSGRSSWQAIFPSLHRLYGISATVCRPALSGKELLVRKNHSAEMSRCAEVGDIHRTLLYGGIFAYPADNKNQAPFLQGRVICRLLLRKESSPKVRKGK